MESEKKDLIYFPRVYLHKLTEKLTKKAIVKYVQSKINDPDWIGSLKIIIDKNDFVFIKFHNLDDGSLYAKCKVEDYPTPTIQLLTDLEKCFHLKLQNENGDNFTNVLSFIDKSAANDFKSTLKSYFKIMKDKPINKKIETKNSKESLDIIKEQIDQRLINKDKGLWFFELYVKELTKLNELAINGYDKIYDSFQKVYQDALKLINEPTTEDIYKKIYTTSSTEQCITTTTTIAALSQVNNKNKENNNNQRKRTVNEITIIADDDKENKNHNNNDDDDDGDGDNAVVQTIVKSKSKKIKNKKLKEKKENKLTENDNIVVEIKDDNKKNPQAIKKQRLSQNIDNNSLNNSDLENVENEVKLKKKQRIAKTKANNKLNKVKKTSAKRSTLESVIVDQEKLKQQNLNNNQVLKTPSTNRMRIEALMESNKKTIKAEPIRPVTRANGKVKQAVQIFEQMKTITNTASKVNSNNNLSVLLASASKPNNQESNQRVLRVNASKIRSSIDKRKLRTSQAKREIKRKSIKKVNAFIKAAADLNSTSNLKSQTNTNNNNLADQTIQEEIINSAERRMTRDILSSTMLQQQYRIATTLKTNPERKQSLLSNNFLERNTPSKLTKTELDEKRKAEVLHKAKKDEERLQELEKQKKEKIEIEKKKREEKMMKIIELKAKRQEDEVKRREEFEAKRKEMEENKKRLAEEKKREEQKQREQRLLDEKRKQEEQIHHSKIQYNASSHNITTTTTTNILGSAIKPKPIDSRFHLPPTGKTILTHTGDNNNENISSYNKLNYQSSLNDKSKPVVLLNKLSAMPLKQLETTYVLNTPGVDQNMALKKPSLSTKLYNTSLYNQFSSNPNNYPATPLAELKLKDKDNYDVSNLKSSDETDDEEEPSKPIPQWAKDDQIKQKAREQCFRTLNYTKIFREASNCEIKLDEIFRTKRKKFNERSSSANWSSPPIWRTGINGEESFRKLHLK